VIPRATTAPGRIILGVKQAGGGARAKWHRKRNETCKHRHETGKTRSGKDLADSSIEEIKAQKRKQGEGKRYKKKKQRI